MDAVFSGEFFEISFIYNGTQVEDLYNFFSLADIWSDQYTAQAAGIKSSLNFAIAY